MSLLFSKFNTFWTVSTEQQRTVKQVLRLFYWVPFSFVWSFHRPSSPLPVTWLPLRTKTSRNLVLDPSRIVLGKYASDSRDLGYSGTAVVAQWDQLWRCLFRHLHRWNCIRRRFPALADSSTVHGCRPLLRVCLLQIESQSSWRLRSAGPESFHSAVHSAWFVGWMRGVAAQISSLVALPLRVWLLLVALKVGRMRDICWRIPACNTNLHWGRQPWQMDSSLLWTFLQSADSCWPAIRRTCASLQIHPTLQIASWTWKIHRLMTRESASHPEVVSVQRDA